MRQEYNLGGLDWMLAGWTPFIWRQQRAIESGATHNAEVGGIHARVPGSVQGALLEAGVIPDWNVGLEARACEWVENRHWVYTASLPDNWLPAGATVRLRALGLDYRGWVLVNGATAGTFTGTFVPHVFDLTAFLRQRENVVQIVFDTPPRWLGQIGYTSRMTEWKPRFNYFWDWTSRLVQCGIWDDLLLEVTDGREILALDVRAGAQGGAGHLRVRGTVVGGENATVHVALRGPAGTVREETVPAAEFSRGIAWSGLPVDLWWPNGEGAQPLYELCCVLRDAGGVELDVRRRRVGFRAIDWRPCEGAPAGADPWLCAVNDRPIFLQGVNWTPIRPNFADVTDDQYRRRLALYRDLGCNTLRVWGGAFLEKEVFYDLCDEMGLLVWQEFPLSSSGLENEPPAEEEAIAAMAEIARSYIERRRHHVSLLLWCGGNELTVGDEVIPVDERHPMIARLAEVAREHDRDRRFLPTSPSGPRFDATPDRFGTGVHWDVHGPWHARGDLDTDWTQYWAENDGLFHSEVGVAGASPVALIRRYAGGLAETPGTLDSPLWRRSSWWIDWPQFVEAHGREPADLEEFVTWDQERQRRALEIATRLTKQRFPGCGGILLWMGHDSFPCTSNTAIVDFDGNPKPAALAVGDVFHGRDPVPGPPETETDTRR